MGKHTEARFTAAWCAWVAAGAALETASLRSGNPNTTLTSHARLAFDRGLFPRLALIAGCAWWVWHVLGPDGGPRG